MQNLFCLPRKLCYLCGFCFFNNCLDLLPKILNHCFNVCIHLCFSSKQWITNNPVTSKPVSLVPVARHSFKNRNNSDFPEHLNRQSQATGLPLSAEPLPFFPLIFSCGQRRKYKCGVKALLNASVWVNGGLCTCKACALAGVWYVCWYMCSEFRWQYTWVFLVGCFVGFFPHSINCVVCQVLCFFFPF